MATMAEVFSRFADEYQKHRILICASSASKAPWFVFKNFPDYVVHPILAYVVKANNHIAQSIA